MFNILNYNIRSFNKNANCFLPIIEKSDPHIVILSETWFKDEFQSPITNFNDHHTVRSDRQSGGVSVYVKDTLPSRKVPELSYVNSDIEICTVETKVNGEPIFIIGIYRPHSGTVDAFSGELERVLQNPLLRARRCCVTGDLNICLLQDNHSNTQFVNTFQSHHYFPVITKPTRFSATDNHLPSLLDHIWYNSLNIFESGIVSLDLTDHCPTFLQIPLLNLDSVDNNDNVKITFRLNNQRNRERFRQKVSDFDWASLSSNSIDLYVDNFSKKIDDLYCSSFPLKTKYIPKRKAMNPWFTHDLSELIKKKSTYFELYRLGAITKEENNRFKNKVKSKIDKAKNNYYNNLLKNNFGNIRFMWETLNSLMNRQSKDRSPGCILEGSREIYEDEEIANVFNNYFTNVPLELDENVPNTYLNPLHFINTDLNSSLVNFEPCTPIEVSSIMGNLKITKQDKNSVPIRLMLANRDVLSIVISDMINQAMRDGMFPSSLKIAKIIPIYKKGDARIPANYRPISLLPYLSKIFEKVIFSRLMNHFILNEIISPYQFGFRKQISTLDAIIHFTENIYDALNGKISSLSILIDYSRAFDTVNHSILLQKLESYGVRGGALQFISSYLKDRQQAVNIRNKCSDTKISNISVPQGSILGPLLFLIYINEIPSISQLFTPTMFADDCTLTMTGSNLDNLINECNRELATFKSWSDANRLTINVSKTNCLLISNVFNTIPPNSLILNDQEIDVVQCVKFLGVYIDSNLKFDEHISYICGKISKSIGILYRIRSCVPKDILRNVYFGIIQPYYIYCLPVFGATYEVHLEPLRLLQKRAIRIISNASFYEHTEPLFYLNNILKVDDLYIHSLGCYMYNNQHLLTSYTHSHDYFTRNRAQYVPPIARLRSTEQSVILNAISVWNDIPADIKACRTKQNFKYKFKKHLLAQYSPEADISQHVVP